MEDIYSGLTKFIKENDNFIIMTHSNPDLDGIASSICLHEIIKGFNKKVFIYRNKKIENKSVNNLLDKLYANDIDIEYATDDFYEYLENPSVIILDVNKVQLLENKKILDFTKKLVVIDHHIKSSDYIKNTTLSYVNCNLSSIAEFMTGFIIFLNKKMDMMLSTALLSAISIDTNNFTIKTTAQTHEKAAYLLNAGANNGQVIEILKENKDEYLKRQDLIKNSFMYNKNTAICTFDELIYKKEELAITSEELITFEDIELSFTIGRVSKNAVGISARSIGKHNVCDIMKKLHGGGHSNEAACVLENVDIIEAQNMLMEVLDESNIY